MIPSPPPATATIDIMGSALMKCCWMLLCVSISLVISVVWCKTRNLGSQPLRPDLYIKLCGPQEFSLESFVRSNPSVQDKPVKPKNWAMPTGVGVEVSSWIGNLSNVDGLGFTARRNQNVLGQVEVSGTAECGWISCGVLSSETDLPQHGGRSPVILNRILNAGHEFGRSIDRRFKSLKRTVSSQIVPVRFPDEKVQDRTFHLALQPQHTQSSFGLPLRCEIGSIRIAQSNTGNYQNAKVYRSVYKAIRIVLGVFSFFFGTWLTEYCDRTFDSDTTRP